MSASKVKAGQVFVEIGADPRAFFRALNSINRQIGNVGRSVASAGAKLGAIGSMAAAPFAAAAVAGSRFEDTLLAVKASTGATAGELAAVRNAAMATSEALGVGPTQATQGFLELLKAGMSLDDVLGGAGQTAIQFAKVGNMDVAAAAVVMADAMKVFGVSSEVAANTLSSAADASSTSVEGLTQAFAQVSAQAALSNQSIGDTSAALAIMANNGVKGSDAGTSLKTMLQRLSAPVDDAANALNQLGLSTQSFRGADGKMKPLVDIIGTLNGALGGMDQAAKDDIFRRIFGSDAIRAAAILTSTGTEGFDAIRQAMGQALPVGEKYDAMMSGLSGAMARITAATQRAAIAVSDALGPSLMSIAGPIANVIGGFTKFVQANQEIVATFAKFSVGAIAVGGVLVALGGTLTLISAAIAPVLTAFGAMATVAGIVLGPVATLSRVMIAFGSASKLISPLSAAFAATTSSISATGAAIVNVGSSLALLVTLAAGNGVAAFTALTGTAARFGSVAAAAASAAFPVFFTGFSRALTAGDGFFAATTRGFRGMVMASSGVRSALAAIYGSGFAKFTADIVSGLQFTFKTFTWWASGVASKLAVYATSLVAAAAAPMAQFASDIAAGLQFTFKTFAWWASGVTAKLTAYVGGTTAAAVASAANAVKSGAAWVAAALPGVMAFVGGAVAGLAAYLGGCAVAVAGSVASAAAVAAAWLTPVAPILAIGAAVVGAGALAYQFGGQLKGALAGAGELAGQAAGAISGGLNAAVSDGMVVFGDLATTAQTTFKGVYEAITQGDLAGAMDVLWAGLQAGWLRGVEAIMGAVDPWVSTFQNAFTILGAEVYKIWDGMWTNVGNSVNMAGAYLLGAFDNIINPILAMWDTLEAGIRKAWIRISGIFKDGEEKQRQLDAVDAEMKSRADQRASDRPGMEGRAAQAQKENEQANQDLADRKRAIDANTEATIAGRQAANQANADARSAATQAAEANLGNKTAGKKEQSARNSDFTALLKEIESASSLDQLRDLYTQFDALSSNGRLTSGQSTTLETALDDAQERISKATSSMGGGPSASQIAAGAGAAGVDAATSKAEVAGTFSSVNLGGMGFASSLGERQLKALETIANNTANLEPAAVGE